MKLDDYETLIKNISIELMHYLINQGANKELAEDVIQDVFVKILKMDMILPPNAIRPYMYRMARNQYIDQYRRQTRFKKLLQSFLIPEASQPQPLIPSDRHEKLAKVLHQLAKKDRQLLKAKYLDGQSITQIAHQTGKSPAAIKMRLYRIRKKLRKVLGDESNE
ncbi:DNA-directed RNA polymerase sigma-70 factor [Lentilactobacillus fungorum]|uniref:DNA-directed RNA polymerase sigma-70 factor n=1 Tax=Lentilactobacillus fungorum TaxID=2201250 RepID=A0ABQ3VXE0_9LACO|nr:sigma-70 family RNA polymerase sigma factor [Lentilactobacillus fungorum]GHP13578.1 DNA-directed RNA polymerase sigma-70 factor [Lentilactobacillus fungorum]